MKRIMGYIKTKRFWTALSAILVVFGLGTYVPVTEVIGEVIVQQETVSFQSEREIEGMNL